MWFGFDDWMGMMKMLGGPTPFVFICITLGAAADVLDCGLLNSAIMESFDITPVFSFSPADGLLLPNAVPNCSKSCYLI